MNALCIKFATLTVIFLSLDVRIWTSIFCSDNVCSWLTCNKIRYKYSFRNSIYFEHSIMQRNSPSISPWLHIKHTLLFRSMFLYESRIMPVHTNKGIFWHPLEVIHAYSKICVILTCMSRLFIRFQRPSQFFVKL